MSLPHGFKAQANRIAVGLRAQMGLAAYDPIDLDALAGWLRVSVVYLSDFAESCPDQVAQLTCRDSAGFSAMIFPIGDGRSIAIVNDAHSPGRQNSSLAHELAHHLLLHSPEEVNNCAGCREFEGGVENEANFLAGCILIPNEAARHIVRSRIDASAAQLRYGVSDRMLEWRLNVSGARIQRRRAQRRRKQAR